MHGKRDDAHMMSQVYCRQGNPLVGTTEAWAAAYAELSRNAAAELQSISSPIKKQLTGTAQQLLWLPDLPALSLPTFSAPSQPVILKAAYEDSADAAALGTSFQLTAEASKQLHDMWTNHNPAVSPVFVVVQDNASANGFYQQLDVLDRSAVQQFLRSQTLQWIGGRVAYIGIILDTESQIKAVEQMPKPVIEPVLSLMLSVKWGDVTPMEMTVQMFLRNEANTEVKT